MAETPEHSSAPRPRFFPSTDQPRFQDCVLVSVGCGTQRTAHTYREDHLQVIEHLDLLREAPAAPSHQVVLTVGRGVTGSPLLSGVSTVIQDTQSLCCGPDTMLVAGDTGVSETASPCLSLPPGDHSPIREADVRQAGPWNY